MNESKLYQLYNYNKNNLLSQLIDEQSLSYKLQEQHNNLLYYFIEQNKDKLKYTADVSQAVKAIGTLQELIDGLASN